ncbi:YacL family protein [Corallococcus llansteffanensis]|uniref:YacL family protein n=1 Tax=Corallococcus llansteffanensis TaxID=2316731 RepID=UPI0011C3DC88|nr:YacL family protein [Corallococcus llansteffanensis]
MRFTWDQQGRVVVRGLPPDDVLADYLAQELRSEPARAEHMLRVLKAVRRGNRERWDVNGDAWSLELSRARASIHSEEAIPGRSQDLPLEEFEEAVRSWLAFMELSRAH